MVYLVMPANAGVQILMSCGFRPQPFWNWILVSANMMEKSTSPGIKQCHSAYTPFYHRQQDYLVSVAD
jgi:hypothetical protein